MKKIYSFLLAAFMVISVSNSVFADTDMATEQRQVEAAIIENNNMVLEDVINYSYEENGLLFVVTEKTYSSELTSDNDRNVSGPNYINVLALKSKSRDTDVYDANNSRIFHANYHSYLYYTSDGERVGFNSGGAYINTQGAGSDFALGTTSHAFGPSYSYVYLKVPYSYTDTKGMLRKYTDADLTGYATD